MTENKVVILCHVTIQLNLKFINIYLFKIFKLLLCKKISIKTFIFYAKKNDLNIFLLKFKYNRSIQIF